MPTTLTGVEDGQHVTVGGQPGLLLTANEYIDWAWTRILLRILGLFAAGATVLAGAGYFIYEAGFSNIRLSVENQVKESVDAAVSAKLDEFSRNADTAVRAAVSRDKEFKSQIEDLVNTIFDDPNAKNELMTGVATKFADDFAEVIAISALDRFVRLSYGEQTDGIKADRRRYLAQFMSFDESGGANLVERLGRGELPNGAACNASDCVLFVADEDEPFVQDMLKHIQPSEIDLDWRSKLGSILDRIAGGKADPVGTYGELVSRLPDGPLISEATDWIQRNETVSGAEDIAAGLARGGKAGTRRILADWLTGPDDALSSIASSALAVVDVSGASPAERRRLAEAVISASEKAAASTVSGPPMSSRQWIDKFYDEAMHGRRDALERRCAGTDDDSTSVRGVVCRYYQSDPDRVLREFRDNFPTTDEFYSQATDAASDDDATVESDADEPGQQLESALAQVLSARDEPSDWREVIQGHFDASQRQATLLRVWTSVIERDTAEGSDRRRVLANELFGDLFANASETRLASLTMDARESVELIVKNIDEGPATRFADLVVGQLMSSSAKLSENEGYAALLGAVLDRLETSENPRAVIDAMQRGFERGGGAKSAGTKTLLEILARALAPYDFDESSPKAGSGLGDAFRSALAGAASRVEYTDGDQRLAWLDLVDLILRMPEADQWKDPDLVVGAARANASYTLSSAKDGLDGTDGASEAGRRIDALLAYLQEVAVPWRGTFVRDARECPLDTPMEGGAEHWCSFPPGEGKLRLVQEGGPLDYFLVVAEDGDVVDGRICRDAACNIVEDGYQQLYVLLVSSEEFQLTQPPVHILGSRGAAALSVGQYTIEDDNGDGGQKSRFALPVPEVATRLTIDTTELDDPVDTVLEVYRSGEESDNIQYDDDGGDSLGSHLDFVVEPGEHLDLVVSNIGSKGSFTLAVAAAEERPD